MMETLIPMPTLRLNIIGAGKVGKTLARLWHENRVFQIGDVLNRSIESSRQAVGAIGGGCAVARLQDMSPADVWLLAVADDAIEACSQNLARTGLLHGQTPAAPVVFHCSGALASTLLAAAREQGASIASAHPIRSFAGAEQAETLQGSWCGIEGDDQAVALVGRAFEALRARLVPLRPESKLIYHSAAVFACNYLVTLMDVAMQAYEKSGVPPEVAMQLLEPLVRGTVDNVFRLGPAAALTGPIARGDLATARRQQHELVEWNAEIGQLYQQFMTLTMELAEKRK
jgi:predicted short-subunit dehydrogenase-like oxidoreductase (DUF2520 family)